MKFKEGKTRAQVKYVGRNQPPSLPRPLPPPPPRPRRNDTVVRGLITVIVIN